MFTANIKMCVFLCVWFKSPPDSIVANASWLLWVWRFLLGVVTVFVDIF